MIRESYFFVTNLLRHDLDRFRTSIGLDVWERRVFRQLPVQNASVARLVALSITVPTGPGHLHSLTPISPSRPKAKA